MIKRCIISLMSYGALAWYWLALPSFSRLLILFSKIQIGHFQLNIIAYQVLRAWTFACHSWMNYHLFSVSLCSCLCLFVLFSLSIHLVIVSCCFKYFIKQKKICLFAGQRMRITLLMIFGMWRIMLWWWCWRKLLSKQTFLSLLSFSLIGTFSFLCSLTPKVHLLITQHIIVLRVSFRGTFGFIFLIY